MWVMRNKVRVKKVREKTQQREGVRGITGKCEKLTDVERKKETDEL